MSEFAKRPSRIVPAVVGLGLAALGLLLILLLFTGPDDRQGPFEWLALLGPALVVAGGVTCVRGWFCRVSAFSRSNVLATGLVMLAVGIFPWIYTGLLIGDHGGEGSGMLGTILFVTVGVPGLIVTLVGLGLRLWDRIG